MTTQQLILAAEGVAPVTYSGPPALIYAAYSATPDVAWLTGSSYSKISDPATMPVAGVAAVDRSSNGRWVAVSDNGTTPSTVKIYDMQSGAPVYSRSVTPSATGANIVCIRFSPDGTKMLVTDATVSPYIWVYDVSTWTTTTSPAPGQATRGARWSPDSAHIAILFITTPFLKIYDTATGSVSANQPATLPTSGDTRQLEYSPDGGHLAAMSNNSSDLLWVWRTDTWARISSPATMPTAVPTFQHHTMVWSPDSTRLMVLTNTSPFIWSYTLSGHTLTYEAPPGTLPGAAVQAIVFAPNGAKVFASPAVSPWIIAYNIPGWTNATGPSGVGSATCVDLHCSIN